MASSVLAAAAAEIAAGAKADPFLWASLAALCLGLAAGQAGRALLPLRLGREGFFDKRPARASRAIFFLGLSLLFGAALLVFADKAALASDMAAGFVLVAESSGASLFLPWLCLVVLLSCLAGLRPLALGLPLLGISLLLPLLLGLALAGWLPLRPGPAIARPTDSFPVARLLPYEVGERSFRGQLELPERDSVPVVQDVALSANAAALSVDSLAFSGPLRLAALLASPAARSSLRLASSSDADASPNATGASAFSPVLRLYRVAGLSSPDGASSLSFREPGGTALLALLLPSPSGSGTRSALLGLASRSRATSRASALVALEPVSFSLSADGSTLSFSPEH